MDARLTINGVERVLGHKALESVAFWLEDEPENSEIFHELAGSGSSEVRAAVAGNTHLSRETFRRLIEDTSVEVLRTIIVSDEARAHMTRRDLECLIAAGDRDILTALANDLESFSGTFQICEKEWLCERLARHSDPAVRFGLAKNTA
ncbi:MAG: hypothetical protein ACOZBW_14355, partial [Thermodesulfobacteriota bacterium]